MPTVRADLAEVHQRAWAELGRPGPFWAGAQRTELMATALDAWAASDPLAPWVAPSKAGRVPPDALAPAAAHDAVYRIARHAGTVTRSWYDEMVAALGELPYVELVALTCTTVAIASFRRTAGLPALALPDVVAGPPTGVVAPDLASAQLNWVPVAAPADANASVVQAFTALPTENARTWAMADAQYMPEDEMIDPRWTRGTLTRPQIELVAMRVSQLRQCFF
ncbi:MAG TPA: hypothetical protein VF855_13310 [Acidimicrobiales bacterium]